MTSQECTFERLTDENASVLQPFFRSCGYGICDNTIGAVYQWRDIYATYFSIVDGFLCIHYGMDADCYTVPIGEGDIDRAFSRIECDATNRGIPLKFCVVPMEALPVLERRYKGRMSMEEVRSWADYVYDADSFRTYAGKQLHAQRNHVNRFCREHPDAKMHVIIDPEMEARVFAFLDRFEAEHPEASELERNEIHGARELLKSRERLGQIAACMTIGDEIIGLSVGEVKCRTLFVHVEKALREIPGSYPAIAQAFVNLFPDVTTVNREDDGGDEGLRYSKLQYRPKKLIAKYMVTIEN